MTQVRAEYVFGVRSAWIVPDLAGRSTQLLYRGRVVQIDIPKGPTFGTEREGTSRFTRAVMSNRANPEAISEIRIGVVAEIQDIPRPNELPFGEERNRLLPLLWKVWREHLPLAQEICGDFLDWVRIRCGQYWLGLHGQEQLPIPGLICTVKHVPTDEDYQIGFTVGQPSAREMPGERPIADLDLEDLRHRFSRNNGFQPADLLLADALTHLCKTPPDRWRAVLLAAIACESKIKSSLVAAVPADRLSLLVLILDNPRDVTVAAINLFDKVAAAVVGRSLRNENKDLYKRIDRLFQTRNRIAHRAEFPEDDVDDLVSAVRDAFAWIAAWGWAERSPLNSKGVPQPGG